MTNGPPQVYRAPMRSREPSIPDDRAAVDRALRLGLVGIGGRLESAQPAMTVDVAVAQVARDHDERMARRLERFAAVVEGSIVFTLDASGSLHVGEIVGPWHYDASAEAAAVDLVHVRPCRWRRDPVADADAPAAVHHTIARGGRNFQRIHDSAVGEISLALLGRA